MNFTFRSKATIDAQETNKSLANERVMLQNYLKETDWYVTRKSERDIAVPDEISIERLNAIYRINVINGLLA